MNGEPEKARQIDEGLYELGRLSVFAGLCLLIVGVTWIALSVWDAPEVELVDEGITEEDQPKENAA